MNKLLKIISIIIITGCSTTNEYIIIEEVEPDHIDLAITEVVKEKYIGY